MKYWLIKSEPSVYSIDDMKSDGETFWDGVRNYQARNFMMNEMKKGDPVLFYHSSSEPPGVAGLVEVCGPASADKTAFDFKSPYFDEKSKHEKPSWYSVPVRFKKKFSALLPLEAIRAEKKLSGMVLLQRGSRLSVQPVKKEEFDLILKLAGG